MKDTGIFMQYACKNCEKMFLGKDVKGRMTIIKGYYCPECQALGFVNPTERPKKKLSAKQQEVLEKNKFGVRKNSSKSKDYPSEVIGGCE